jgi:hypothetical protein
MGVSKNIVSWARMKRIPRRVRSPSFHPSQGALMGKTIGDVIEISGHEIEITAIN